MLRGRTCAWHRLIRPQGPPGAVASGIVIANECHCRQGNWMRHISAIVARSPRPFGGSAAEWIGRPLSRLPIGGAPLSRITCTAFGVHPLACHQSHSSLATLAADEPGLIERRHIVVCASLQPEGTVAFARPFPSRPVQAVPNEHRHGRSLHILRFARKHVGSCRRGTGPYVSPTLACGRPDVGARIAALRVGRAKSSGGEEDDLAAR
jgi:hypothetical protein